MRKSHFSLLVALMCLGSLLLMTACFHGGDCGCTPSPTASVMGRITDGEGRPLADLEVNVVTVSGSGSTSPSFYPVAKGMTNGEGAFNLKADLGHHRIFVRTQGGTTVYQPRLGPDFELKEADVSVTGMDLSLVPTTPANLTVVIDPVHGTLQEDTLSLSQSIQVDGLDYQFQVASVKPAVAGARESTQFLKQPPGAYSLSLGRSETTGTHAQTGTAKATILLVEGEAMELPLSVK